MAIDLGTILASAAAGAIFGIGANLLLQGRKRWSETRSLAMALNREILAGGRKVRAWAVDLNSAAERSEPTVSVARFPLTAEDMLILQSTAGKLGQFPPWLVFHLVELYGEFRALRDRFPDPKPLTREQAQALVEEVLLVLERIDARISTELEVLAITPYWMKLRYELEAWRAERTKVTYRPESPPKRGPTDAGT